MQKPLNRIECEYIFSSFVKDRPNLTVLCNNAFLPLPNSRYKIQEEYVFFKTDKIKKDDELKVYFNHKGRPLYFKTAVDEKQGILFFEIPQRFFKDDTEEDLSVPFVRLISASGFNLRINNFEDYSDYVLPRAEDGELPAFAERIAAAGDLKPELLPEKLLTVMFKVLRGNIPVFKPCVLFTDSEYLLIFSAAEKASPLYGKRPSKTELCFDSRKVDCFAVCDSVHRIESEMVKEECCLILFSITDIQEEDKRYLHEKAYGTKYGKR